MKKIAILGILGIIFISFASASLVDFLSNEARVEIGVRGPIFYTAAGELLMMNEEPSSSSIKTINGIEEIDFKMNNRLDGLDYDYIPKLKFVIDLEINNYTDSRTIEMEFGYVETNGNSKKVCNIQRIGIVSDGEIEVECDATSEMKDVDYFYYTIEGCADENIEYKIKTRNSYVEVISAV